MNSLPRFDYYRWMPSACLRISGEDSATFLQGQFTNDLQQSRGDAAVYGLWLNQKGKVLADSFILRMAVHDYRVVSYFSTAATIRERLEAYVIADDVVIEDQTAETSGVSLIGASAAPSWVPATGWAFSGRRTRAAHTEIIFPQSAEDEVRAALASGVEFSSVAMEQLRIRAEIPAVPADIGPTDLPNEGGLETEAISYTKGCYLGQEVMARLKSMGQVRRRLVRVAGACELPPCPAAVFQKGRKVGELRSAVTENSGWIGLALISLLQVSRHEGLSLTVTGPAEVRIEATP